MTFKSCMLPTPDPTPERVRSSGRSKARRTPTSSEYSNGSSAVVPSIAGGSTVHDPSNGSRQNAKEISRYVTKGEALSLPLSSGLHPLPNLTPDSALSRRVHIPRPPNAFMLYRSHYIKHNPVPPMVEKRQQNLSRLVGQSWNLLPEGVKAYWKAEATRVAQEHHLQHPDYKFTPSRRGTRRSKVQTKENEDEINERIRRIREEYTSIHGPVIPSQRRKKMKAKEENRRDTQPVYPLFPPPQAPDLFPSSSIVDAPPLPPSFPALTLPQLNTPRRPSTSLGSSTNLGADASYSELLRSSYNTSRDHVPTGSSVPAIRGLEVVNMPTPALFIV
ncbi:hypothetical protein AX16_010296 [Volvariella volvacea WC 439]|nr:hypothetical protein AX16_010296 [Volvariella volvacea WC 439]